MYPKKSSWVFQNCWGCCEQQSNGFLFVDASIGAFFLHGMPCLSLRIHFVHGLIWWFSSTNVFFFWWSMTWEHFFVQKNMHFGFHKFKKKKWCFLKNLCISLGVFFSLFAIKNHSMWTWFCSGVDFVFNSSRCRIHSAWSFEKCSFGFQNHKHLLFGVQSQVDFLVFPQELSFSLPSFPFLQWWKDFIQSLLLLLNRFLWLESFAQKWHFPSWIHLILG